MSWTGGPAAPPGAAQKTNTTPLRRWVRHRKDAVTTHEVRKRNKLNQSRITRQN